MAAIAIMVGIGLLAEAAPARGQTADSTVAIDRGLEASGPRILEMEAVYPTGAVEGPRSPSPSPSPSPSTTEQHSGLRAFALNLLVPGLGQRYLNGGDWTGWGALYTGLDAALWLGLTGTVWHRSHVTQTYRTLAATRAGADLAGKDRPFFLQMAQHRSQEAFIDHLLRTRQWGQLSGAEAETRYWAWDSEEAWNEYQETRRRADALGRRRSTLIAGLVAHRLVTGLIALIEARNSDEVPPNDDATSVQLQAPPAPSASPQIRFTVRW